MSTTIQDLQRFVQRTDFSNPDESSHILLNEFYTIFNTMSVFDKVILEQLYQDQTGTEFPSYYYQFKQDCLEDYKEKFANFIIDYFKILTLKQCEIELARQLKSNAFFGHDAPECFQDAF